MIAINVEATRARFCANLADFAKEFAEQHPYYDNNIHVVNTLKKEVDQNIGVNFLNFAESELIGALESHASQDSES